MGYPCPSFVSTPSRCTARLSHRRNGPVRRLAVIDIGGAGIGIAARGGGGEGRDGDVCVSVAGDIPRSYRRACLIVSLTLTLKIKRTRPVWSFVFTCCQKVEEP